MQTRRTLRKHATPSQQQAGLTRSPVFSYGLDRSVRGSGGVRDGGTLLAATARPWQASLGYEHLASPFQKTAALMESIIRRRPFVDGNKRTGTASALYLLPTFA